MHHRFGVRTTFLATHLALSASGCGRYWVCEPTDEARIAILPAALSATGLFADLSTETLGDGVMAFRPAFELWSDGADKRRWIWLPAHTRIDTSDMDSWVFPEGTKLWKEFRRDGVRVETRLIQKIGPGDADWIGLAYLWTEDQGDALPAPFGAIDVLGTPHNVPASGECQGCHGGRKSFVLGFSAIQLSVGAALGDLGLDALVAADLLSDPPEQRFVVPGNSTERAALGYLHANCGHCHNDARPASKGARCFDPDNELRFQLSVSSLSAPADTPTYRSAVGRVVRPGNPDDSRLIDLVSTRGFLRQMPPLASERVDGHAVELLRAWIAEMGR
jgi:hypothetical protein